MAANHIARAVSRLEAAGVLADDGAIITAAVVAREAIDSLAKEWRRRRPTRVGTKYAGHTFEEAVDDEIWRRKAMRA